MTVFLLVVFDQTGLGAGFVTNRKQNWVEVGGDDRLVFGGCSCFTLKAQVQSGNQNNWSCLMPVWLGVGRDNP